MFSVSESGRSMVEMLGVLAIIGVLSIGAVAGYKFAITKYKANETTAITIKHKLNTAKGIIPVSDSNRKCFSFDGNGSCINVPCK